MTKPLHALYGGTFDPIHFGHLKPVTALAQDAALEKVVFMPNNVPPHRPQPEASSEQRRKMVELAIEGNPLFDIDSRELMRETPSWTVETLEAWRTERGMNQPLAFIIGQDSLLSLPHWHRWESLLSLCHLLVLPRPGYSQQLESSQHQEWLIQHQTQDPEQLHRQPAGLVYLASTPLWDISATEIRTRLTQGLDVDALLPESVIRYIRQQKLYGAH